jgi:hypothetical protein
MARLISVTLPHRLGTEEAMRRINAGLRDYTPTSLGSLESAAWTDNKLAWLVHAVGARVIGTTTVFDDRAVLEATLPLVLSPFSRKLESLIQQHGAVLLASSDEKPASPQTTIDPEDIRRIAMTAAEADGKQWAQLSHDERRAYRRAVRESVPKIAG